MESFQMKTDNNQFIKQHDLHVVNKTSLLCNNEDKEMDSIISICPQCDFSTSSIQLLDEHMEKNHGDISNHDSERSYKSNYDINNNHDNNSSDINLDTSYFIKRVTDDVHKKLSETLKPLKQMSDSRRRYRCNICPVTFPWHGDLAAHLAEVHGFQKATRDGSKTKAGSYKCNYCMYVAKYQSELKRHRRLHMGVKPFGCVFCKYKSAWKGDLKRHIESHHRSNFTSEEELASIMSQYKNNAGTDFKDNTTTEDEPNQTNTEDSISETNNKTNDSPLSINESINNLPETNNDMALNLSIKSTTYPTKTSTPDIKIDVNKNYLSKAINFTELTQNIPHIMPQFQLPPNNIATPIQLPHNNNPASHLYNPYNIPPPTLSNNTSLTDLMRGMLSTFNPLIHFNMNALAAVAATCAAATNTNASTPVTCPVVTSSSCSPAPSSLKFPIPNSSLFPLPIQPFTSSCPNTTLSLPLNNNSSPTPQSNNFNGDSTQKQRTNPILNTTASAATVSSSTANNSSRTTSPSIAAISITATSNNNGGNHSGGNCSQSPQQEHWKRFKCSACGHRSNWKWDINKHIKVAHPERDGISTVELSYDQAKATLQAYLESSKAHKARCHNSIDSEEGYYRPFKCSACGHRSNWKWDVNKHIKQVHQHQAHVITLSMDEAKNTICQYKRRRRGGTSSELTGKQPHTNFASSLSNSISQVVSNVISQQNEDAASSSSLAASSSAGKTRHVPQVPNSNPTLNGSTQLQLHHVEPRLVRYFCSECDYTNIYRTQLSKHIRARHKHHRVTIIIKKAAARSSVTTTIWNCDLCGEFTSSNRCRVVRHIHKEHSGRYVYECNCLSSVAFASDKRLDMLRHMKHRHQDGYIMEENISKTIGSRSNRPISIHRDMPTGQGLTCNLCDKFSGEDDQLLFQHIAQLHADSDEQMYVIFKSHKSSDNLDLSSTYMEFYQCQHCRYNTWCVDSARIHQFQHTDYCKYMFVCAHCTYRASHQKFLDYHTQTYCCKPTTHKHRSTSYHFKCGKCSARFTNKYHLLVHYQQHHCSGTSIMPNKPISIIQRHLPTASTSPPSNPMDQLQQFKTSYSPSDQLWCCDECGYVPTANTDDPKIELDSHLTQHQYLALDNTALIFCNLCSFHCSSQEDLNSHGMCHALDELSGLTNKPLSSAELCCNHCQYKTNYAPKLELHMQHHDLASQSQSTTLKSPGSVLSCPKCNFQHNRLYSLIRHMKYHHH